MPVPLQEKEAFVPAYQITFPRSSDFVLQNDDNFLTMIYEAYLSNMTQAAMKKTMWKQNTLKLIFKVLQLKVLSC